MDPSWKKEFNDLICSINKVKEVEELFNALFTPSEYEEFVKRWQIIKMLLEGKSQRAVSAELSVSITTVGRGAREIKYGNSHLKEYFNRLYPKSQ